MINFNILLIKEVFISLIIKERFKGKKQLNNIEKIKKCYIDKLVLSVYIY